MICHSRSSQKKKLGCRSIGQTAANTVALIFAAATFVLFLSPAGNADALSLKDKENWAVTLERQGLTPLEFTECVAEMMKSEKKVSARVIGPLELALSSVGEPGESTCFLTNAWKSSCDYPGSRREVVETYMRAISAIPQASRALEKISLPDVVPIIRTREYFANLDSSLQLKVYHEPFVSDLLLMFAVDMPTSLATMQVEQVQGLKLEPAKLRDIAISNLLKRIPNLEIVQGKQEVGFIRAGGDYEASMLLYEKMWIDLQKKLAGRLIVAVPSRSSVFFVKEGNAAGLQLMKKVAADCFANMDHPISDKLLIFDGSWRSYSD